MKKERETFGGNVAFCWSMPDYVAAILETLYFISITIGIREGANTQQPEVISDAKHILIRGDQNLKPEIMRAVSRRLQDRKWVTGVNGNQHH
jgi:hypothetical protein